MAGRRKYGVLLLVTACITVLITIYGMVSYGPRQGKPGEKIDNPPIEQNKEREQTPHLQPDPPEQPAPVPTPAPEPLPQPAPVPVPAPQPKPKPAPKPSKKAVTPEGSIGGYKTPLLDKNYGRTKNIDLASKRINGYVVEPGGNFSFNGVVGERTVQKGYKSAKVILKGKFVEETGGGICQLSSTLYNAAEKAGLQILERHNHSKKVSYVQEGRDAAVDYGNLDFKFKNTLSHPVEIRAGVKSEEVYAYIVKVQRKTPVSP